MKPRVWILGTGLLMAAFLIAMDTIRLGGRPVIKISGQDPPCYFATAHSILFDRDWDLTNEFAVLNPAKAYPLREEPEVTGLPGSPFAIGYSLLEVPFLAAGTLVDRFAGRPADGYGHFAMTAYFLGNIVFVTLGLLCVHGSLRLLGKELFPRASPSRQEWTSLLVTLALIPATSLGYYAFSPMSHAAGFMSVALFLFAWLRYRRDDRVSSWVLLGLLGGLAILCRWQNLLLMGAPLLADLFGARGRSARSLGGWLKSRFCYGAAGFAMLLPQFAQWKAIYGLYLVNPHGPGVMRFPPGFVPNVLFSTKHGWFVWTPACLLCVAGLILGCVRIPGLFVPWTVALAAEVAVIGSIGYHWSGAESFGIRMLVCTLPIGALGLFYLLMRAVGAGRAVLWGIFSVAAAYSVLFAIQYRLDLVPKNDYLTWSELVADKIRIDRAYRRRTVVRQCDALLGERDGDGCIRLVEEGIRRLGADRALLTALVEAEKIRHHPDEEARARARLAGFLRGALW